MLRLVALHKVAICPSLVGRTPVVTRVNRGRVTLNIAGNPTEGDAKLHTCVTTSTAALMIAGSRPRDASISSGRANESSRMSQSAPSATTSEMAAPPPSIGVHSVE